MRERRRRLKPKAVAAPISGRGPGTDAGAALPRTRSSAVGQEKGAPVLVTIAREVNGVPLSSSQPKKFVAEPVTTDWVDAPGLAVTVMLRFKRLTLMSVAKKYPPTAVGAPVAKFSVNTSLAVLVDNAIEPVPFTGPG